MLDPIAWGRRLFRRFVRGFLQPAVTRIETDASVAAEIRHFSLDGDALVLTLAPANQTALPLFTLRLHHQPPEAVQEVVTELESAHARQRTLKNRLVELEWPWPVAERGVVRGLHCLNPAGQNAVQIPVALQMQLNRLWPLSPAEFYAGFAHRDFRVADVWTQHCVASELFGCDHLGPQARVLLACILVYKRMEFMQNPVAVLSEVGLEAALGCLTQAQPVDDKGLVSTLELQRMLALSTFRLWQGELAQAQSLLETGLVQLEQTADPMRAVEYLLRTRVLLAALHLLAGHKARSMALLEALHPLFQQGVAAADPLRLHDYIQLRKAFQCTSVGGALLRALKTPHPAAFNTLLTQPLRVTVNLPGKARDAVLRQLGVVPEEKKQP